MEKKSILLFACLVFACEGEINRQKPNRDVQEGNEKKDLGEGGQTPDVGRRDMAANDATNDRGSVSGRDMTDTRENPDLEDFDSGPARKPIVLDVLKSFPTAQGAGAGTTGGRGGKVVYVTNTNDSGDGSLHQALFAHGNETRTILFATGGRFNVPLYQWQEAKGNFTLAGQSAHALGGVHLFSTVTNGKNGSYYLTYSQNMIIRYFSAKGGWEQGSDITARIQAFTTRDSVDVIYDHFSSGWSGAYLFDIDGGAEAQGPGGVTKIGRVTMQYSLGHENVDSENVGGVMGSYWNSLPGTDPERTTLYNQMFGSLDFHHNAYIQVDHRHTGNIYAGATGRYKRISNYIYGIGGRLDRHVGDFQTDYINNLYETNKNRPVLGKNQFHKLEFYDDGTAPPGRAYAPSIYMKGNRVVFHDGSVFIDDQNQWDMWSIYKDVIHATWNGTPVEGLKNGDQVPPDYERKTPIPKHPLYPIDLTPTSEVKAYTLANAGSGVRFNADGTTRNVDEIDKAYIELAKTKTGGVMGDSTAFIIPSYPSTTLDLTVFDADLDGLPDAWETLHGVSEATAVKRDWEIQGYLIENNAGYTNLEMYLAELAGDFHMLAR